MPDPVYLKTYQNLIDKSGESLYYFGTVFFEEGKNQNTYYEIAYSYL